MTGSTNADLSSLVQSGHPLEEGRWLVADRQRAGRGRHGRVWQDGVGNFMGSTIVQLRSADPPAHSVALIAGLATHDVVSAVAAGHDIALKWPNDLLASGAKLAGCLVERTGDVLIIGIGINLVHAPVVESRATAALADLGIDFARDACAGALAEHFAARLWQWRSGGWPDAVITDWMAAAHPRGTLLLLSDGAQAGLTGAYDGLEQDGSLRLRLDDGGVHIVRAGEVLMAGGPARSDREQQG